MSHRYPPGPQGAALIRTALQVRSSIIPTLSDLARTYGDLVHLGAPGYHFYLVNHPDLVYELLVWESSRVRKPRSRSRPLVDILGNGLLISQGSYWRQQRRLMQPAFHRRRIEGYAECMVACATDALTRWHSGDIVEMQHEMMRLTLGMVTRAFFSTDMTAHAETIIEAVELIQHICYRQGQTPVWLPLLPNREKARAIARLDAIVMQLIHEWRASGVDHGDMLSMLLTACGEDRQPLTDAQVHDEVMTVLLAGHESTANALVWTWYLLSQHPDVEAALADELARVLGGRAPTFDDFAKLPYLQQVIKEALRLYPPAWALPREAAEPVTLGGYTIPKGSMIVAMPYLLHRDPRFYDDPEAFKPERFTPDFEKQLHRYAYLPFGAGPRQCIGNSFALLAMQITLATVCQHWRWRLVPGHPVELDPLLTLCSRYGMRMQAESVRDRALLLAD